MAAPQWPGYQQPQAYGPTPITPTDLDHLRLLSIGYYVAAGLSFLFGLFPLIHLGMGLAMVTGKFPGGAGATPPGFPMAFGWFFVAIAALMIGFMQLTAILNLVTARSLSTRRRRMFCMVIAGLNCLHAPLGTLLGVFTFVVLSRPGVKAAFEQAVLEDS